MENVHRLFLSQSQPIENAGQIYHNDPQVEGNFTSGDVLLKNEAKQQQCDRSKFLYMPLEANNDRLESAIMLTKSSLQKHDQRCEQECKNNWRQRLSLKRMAQDQVCHISQIKIHTLSFSKLFRHNHLPNHPKYQKRMFLEPLAVIRIVIFPSSNPIR